MKPNPDDLAKLSDLNRINRERQLRMEAEIAGVEWQELLSMAQLYASGESEYDPRTDT
jgi:hypothetical protein